MKHCNNCDKYFDRTAENFYRNKSRPDGLEAYCKTCSLSSSKKWKKDNPDGYSKDQYHWQQSWHLKNPGKKASWTAKRRAALLERTPPWLTKKHFNEITSFYEWSDYLNGDTEVDHIIPLQGANVSGLHVPWNLQVISELENGRKGNRL